MATAAPTVQQGQGQIGQSAQQQAGTTQPTHQAQVQVQVQAETPPLRRITDYASI